MPTTSIPFARPPLTRRGLLAHAGLAALLAASGLLFLPTPPARAQRRKAASAPEQVPVEELMKPGELPDLAIGKPDAPVTIIEYQSMTCGHCATFHIKIFPELKTKYIDTGKVRFIVREFPLDSRAAVAAMLARCAGGDKTLALISVLFEKQEQWAFTRGDPLPELAKIAKQAGLTEDAFKKCVSDQKLFDAIKAGTQRASEQFGVDSTPTFFVNGKRMHAGSIAEFDKVLEPLVGKPS